MIFDIEADGLEDATKIHVLAYNTKQGVKFTHDYNEMRKILTEAKLLIGHNIILYDIPTIERILGIKITATIFDTLPLSWYLNHDRIRHGLDVYGEEFGIKKPEINDWEYLTKEEYAHRCVEDVKINKRLWFDLKNKLLKLYGNKDKASKLLSYLTFKMQCAALQEKSRWKADISLIDKSISELSEQLDEKTQALKLEMPKKSIYSIKTRPAKPFKKGGTWSTHGARWFNLLSELGLPEDYDGEVKVKIEDEYGNPNSTQQIKDWLYSIGWSPQNFKYARNPDGSERKIPQVRVDGDNGKELCKSVKKLIDKNPSLTLLDGMTVLQHRLSVFEGFKSNLSKDGYLIARIGGLTNTLRFKHRELVNLPGVSSNWGKQIRGSLIAREGKILCGSDMCSLEETTKKHYMYPYDPEFVEEMSKEDFDAHLDLAKHAGQVSQQDIDDYVNKVVGAKNLKPLRSNYKAANYACTYGVQKYTLARQTGLSNKEAQGLIDSYWKRNWALLEVIKNVKTKTINGKQWLYNPVSELWYSLRSEKDKFSTLNQGTGVWCFDKWISYILSKRCQLTGQFHDEIIIEIKEGYEDKCEALLKWAIEQVNNELKLNVKLDVDVQFGKTYAEIH